ncbi:hypothetical protein LJ737_20765 [Hymenobacter sp. 15J16-1T3B]|uniref:hypothetical protein n=1 Tax=Hymenobacter sp. 15J16-1T3B TaxID=2886941 RepID=UPI001D12E196|nr:hypothetical protein [Hymenobacter sp. 15J16-1T3B]MCC3159686.1 hypothetical protein [Hymenobacter sp. 15J16-1T3B]
MQYKVTHTASKHVDTLDAKQLEALKSTFTGRQRFEDLYSVKEVKAVEKPQPLTEEPTAGAPAGRGSKTPKADAQASE